VAERPDAAPATSRTAVTSLEPSKQWPATGAAETRGATAITAEIPAVPVAPSYGVLLPDGSIWYPGSKRKLPAPAALRITVWVLALLVAITGAGLIVEHYHPSWLDPVRHVVGPPGVLPGNTTTPTTTHPGSGQTSDKLVQTGSGPNSVTYSVPAAPYVLEIKTTQRCYIQVKSISTGSYLLDDTLAGGVLQQVTVPTGAATIEAYAGGSSLTVDLDGKQIGDVGTLGYAVVYRFNPPGQ